MWKELLHSIFPSQHWQSFSQFLHFISYKYNLEHELLTQDLNEFVLDEKDKFEELLISSIARNFLFSLILASIVMSSNIKSPLLMYILFSI